MGWVSFVAGRSQHWLCPEGIVATSDARASFTVNDLASGSQYQIPGVLRSLWVVSSEAALALVDPDSATGDVVPLDGREMKVIVVPAGAWEWPPLWSAAVRGSVYYDLEEQGLFLWRPQSPTRRLWPNP
jgi:hypothetical protein